MSARLRSRCTFANVCSALALFVALGTGGAYAANRFTGADIVDESLTGVDIRGKAGTSTDAAVNGTVTTHDIAGQAASASNGTPYVNGTVTGWDVADNSLESRDVRDASLGGSDVADGTLAGADVKDGSLGGGDVRDESLFGADVVESSLGKVPDADRLDGIDASGFVRGPGEVVSNRVTASAGGSVALLASPAFGTITGRCYADSASGSGLDFTYTNTTSDMLHVGWQEEPRGLLDDLVVAPGLGVAGPGFAFTGGTDRNRVTFVIGRDVGAAHRLAVVEAMGFQYEGSPSSCVFVGQAVTSRG